MVISKGISIRGYTLFELTDNPDRFGTEKPYDPVAYPKAKVFPFDRIVEAHNYVEKNQALGKVVVKL